MFLSVIIPTWRNTEEEIRRCLDSIDQSAWRDFEVLLVDDGNEPAYAAMLDGLVETYPLLRVFHLPHGGVSAARNFGMTKAQGEYILFVDADDIVTKQFWYDAAEIAAKRPDADIIYGRIWNTETGPFIDNLCERLDLCELNEEETRELYGHFFALQAKKYVKVNGIYLSRGSIARLVRRTFALRCPFRSDLICGEDMVWNFDLLKEKPRMAVTEHVWYCIVGNPESVTRGCRPELIEWHRQLLQVLQNYVTPDTERDYYCRVFESLAEIGKRYYLSPKNPLSWSQKVKEFNQMTRTEPFSLLLKFDAKTGGGKTALKLALYKAGFLLYAYKLKMLLRR